MGCGASAAKGPAPIPASALKDLAPDDFTLAEVPAGGFPGKFPWAEVQDGGFINTQSNRLLKLQRTQFDHKGNDVGPHYEIKDCQGGASFTIFTVRGAVDGWDPANKCIFSENGKPVFVLNPSDSGVPPSSVCSFTSWTDPRVTQKVFSHETVKVRDIIGKATQKMITAKMEPAMESTDLYGYFDLNPTPGTPCAGFITKGKPWSDFKGGANELSTWAGDIVAKVHDREEYKRPEGSEDKLRFNYEESTEKEYFLEVAKGADAAACVALCLAADYA